MNLLKCIYPLSNHMIYPLHLYWIGSSIRRMDSNSSTLSRPRPRRQPSNRRLCRVFRDRPKRLTCGAFCGRRHSPGRADPSSLASGGRSKSRCCSQDDGRACGGGIWPAVLTLSAGTGPVRDRHRPQSPENDSPLPRPPPPPPWRPADPPWILGGGGCDDKKGRRQRR